MRARYLLFFLYLTLPVLSHAQDQAAASPQQEHRLSPGDIVSVQVFGEPELTITAIRLSAGGKVTMPLVGEVTLLGKSASESASVIEARLKQGYLVSPRVTVLLGETSRSQFTILGAVARQGPFLFPVSGKITLVEAIASAGGFSRVAKQTNVKVTRTTGGREEEFTLDVKNDVAAKSFPVRPGDVINIAESRF